MTTITLLYHHHIITVPLYLFLRFLFHGATVVQP